MRRVHAIVAVALASSLALLQSACMLSGKPKTSAVVAPPQPKPVAAKPVAPPEALSVAQTQVQLPPPQPVNPDAVALPQPKPEAGAPPPATPRPIRRIAPPQPKPDTSVPAATAPAVPAPAEPELAPVQEMLTPAERKRFQDSAESRKTEIRHLITQIKSHHPTAEANREVKRIQSLVAQSDDVEKHGDMRQADALAERALILARELADGK
jgi:hypothetical protein